MYKYLIHEKCIAARYVGAYIYIHVVDAIHKFMHVYVYIFMFMFQNMKHEI